MGSQSDWSTMKHAAKTLDALGIGYEARIVSAHRTPKRLYDFAGSARKNGFKVIIAGAGGAAHLPGMCTHSLDQARQQSFTAMQFNFVIASNERAVRLWQGLGFIIVGRLPGAFQHPQLGIVDAYVMMRNL